MNVPRKFLLVKRAPPADGYVVMIEANDRTRSLQLSEAHGEAVMMAIQEVIVTFAIQRGLVTMDAPVIHTPGRPRASRTGGRKRAP